MDNVYIPDGTEWYVAELVVVFTFTAVPENLVHINTVLIRAQSPDVAYDKAINHGKLENRTFTNSDGEDVKVVFRGLHGLYPVYDELGDGAELMYEKRENVSDIDIESLLSPKEQLAVFSSNWDRDRER